MWTSLSIWDFAIENSARWIHLNWSLQFHQRSIESILIIHFGARNTLVNAPNRDNILLKTGASKKSKFRLILLQEKIRFIFFKHPVNSTYVFLLTLLIQLFGYCTCGQLVLNRVSNTFFSVSLKAARSSFNHHFQGENVSRAIYCSNWYRIADSEQRRWTQMFILCTQKPNGLSAMNIFQFSFHSLTYVRRIFDVFRDSIYLSPILWNRF